MSPNSVRETVLMRRSKAVMSDGPGINVVKRHKIRAKGKFGERVYQKRTV